MLVKNAPYKTATWSKTSPASFTDPSLTIHFNSLKSALKLNQLKVKQFPQ